VPHLDKGLKVLGNALHSRPYTRWLSWLTTDWLLYNFSALFALCITPFRLSSIVFLAVLWTSVMRSGRSSGWWLFALLCVLSLALFQDFLRKFCSWEFVVGLTNLLSYFWYVFVCNTFSFSDSWGAETLLSLFIWPTSWIDFCLFLFSLHVCDLKYLHVVLANCHPFSPSLESFPFLRCSAVKLRLMVATFICLLSYLWSGINPLITVIAFCLSLSRGNATCPFNLLYYRLFFFCSAVCSQLLPSWLMDAPCECHGLSLYF